jgi:uncharacterized membrane protein
MQGQIITATSVVFVFGSFMEVAGWHFAWWRRYQECFCRYKINKETINIFFSLQRTHFGWSPRINSLCLCLILSVSPLTLVLINHWQGTRPQTGLGAFPGIPAAWLESWVLAKGFWKHRVSFRPISPVGSLCSHVEQKRMWGVGWCQSPSPLPLPFPLPVI